LSDVSLLPRSVLAVAVTAVLATSGSSISAPDAAGHAAAVPAPVGEVVSFGDSWTDAGTFGYVYGTAGGGSWAQLLAAEYGADQEPNRRVQRGGDGTVSGTPVGGLNYAEGGAVVSPPTADPEDVPLPTADPDDVPRPVSAQLAAFLRQHGRFAPDEMVTVWAGANDILSILHGSGDADRARRFTTGQLTAAEMAEAAVDVQAAARREAALVSDMLRASARWVAVLTVIDQGITAQAPGIQAGGNAEAGALTTTYNQALAAALPHDPRVALVDVAGLFADVQVHPAAYGYRVVDGDACTNGGPRCDPGEWKTPDADRTFAFAAYGHFTTATRQLVARFVHDQAGQAWGW
jgi:outer membrane lipase/esterase